MSVLERKFFTDPEILQDPTPYHAALREPGPVWHEPHHGVVILSGIEEILDVYADHEHFSAIVSSLGPMVKLPEPSEGESWAARSTRGRRPLGRADHGLRGRALLRPGPARPPAVAPGECWPEGTRLTTRSPSHGRNAMDMGLLMFPSPTGSAFMAQRAEQMGFSSVVYADTQCLTPEVWSQLMLVAAATERIEIGTGVTNPVSRAPSVTASAALGLQVASGGRVVLGIGRGDSSMAKIGKRPAPPAGLRLSPLALEAGLPSDSQLATVWTMSIASIVREARRRAGLTQAALAERAGVPKSTVGRIESGARTPSVELVERLVRAAGLEVTVSLSESDPGTDSMFERTLRRTPAQRLADATRAARFVLRGRRELAAAPDG